MKSIFRTVSIFSTLSEYIRWTMRGIGSIGSGLRASLPYLMGKNATDLRKEVTEEYPDPVSCRTPEELPARTRGLLHNDIERCIGCQACARVCPVQCITTETDRGPDELKVWVSVFDIDVSRCLYCGLCVSVCPPSSLVHTREYENAVTHLNQLVKSFGRGRITAEQRSKWTQNEGSTEGDFSL